MHRWNAGGQQSTRTLVSGQAQQIFFFLGASALALPAGKLLIRSCNAIELAGLRCNGHRPLNRRSGIHGTDHQAMKAIKHHVVTRLDDGSQVKVMPQLRHQQEDHWNRPMVGLPAQSCQYPFHLPLEWL